MERSIENILKKEKIKDFTKDIRLMPRKELCNNFSFGKNKKKLNVPCLIRNLIWQSYTWIQSGKTEPIEGNIRSFWYWNLKPVLSRLNLNVYSTKYTLILYSMFVKMITMHNLFRYMDFGFIDEREHVRVVGEKLGNIIIYIEKDGLFNIVKRVAKKYDVTGLSLCGFPSYLHTEYLLYNMIKKDLLRKPVFLLGVTDYDPSGWHIEKEFGRQLHEYGVEVLMNKSLIDVKDLSIELIEACKYKLKNNSMAKKWIEENNGGIQGKAFGLEADALGSKQITKLFEKALEGIIEENNKFRFVDSVKNDRLINFLGKEDKFKCVTIE